MNESHNLSIELLRRIFGNIGLVSGKNFGKVGITTKEYLTSKTIKITDEDHNLNEYSVWAAHLTLGLHNMTIGVVAFIDDDSSEFLLTLLIDENIFGLSLDTSDLSTYSFLSKVQNNWVALTLLQQLNIATLIETCTQEGLTWTNCSDLSKVYPELLSFTEEYLGFPSLDHT